jgi:hypothetical protein
MRLFSYKEIFEEVEVVLLDDVKIYLKAILEVAKNESVQRIQSQLPEIEKALRAIQVPIEIDEKGVASSAASMVNNLGNAINAQTKKSSSLISKAFSNLKITPTLDSVAAEKSMKQFVKEMEQTKGALSKIKVQTGFTNDADAKNLKALTGAVLEYKNAQGDLVQQTIDIGKLLIPMARVFNQCGLLIKRILHKTLMR